MIGVGPEQQLERSLLRGNSSNTQACVGVESEALAGELHRFVHASQTIHQPHLGFVRTGPDPTFGDLENILTPGQSRRLLGVISPQVERAVRKALGAYIEGETAAPAEPAEPTE